MFRNKVRIVVIDQDIRTHEFIRHSLQVLHAELNFFTAVGPALEYARHHAPSLAIMDIMNPDIDGIKLCSEFRSASGLKDTLIAFFTNRGEDYSQIAGFNAGADDYIIKPCRPVIFLSRIQALLRRQKLRTELPQVQGIVIDRERYLVRKGALEIFLPRKEFELVALLVSAPRKVFTRQEIYSFIWGGEMDRRNRTIDVHVRKLREKIGEEYIKTIKGIGYSFER